MRILRNLGRDCKRRRAMMRNMVTALIKKERLETTITRARVLKGVADHMITLGKRGTRPAWLKANAFIFERPAAVKVFTELAERYKSRPAGFTRIIKSRYRARDYAPMAFIEFVDRPGELFPTAFKMKEAKRLAQQEEEEKTESEQEVETSEAKESDQTTIDSSKAIASETKPKAKLQKVNKQQQQQQPQPQKQKQKQQEKKQQPSIHEQMARLNSLPARRSAVIKKSVVTLAEMNEYDSKKKDRSAIAKYRRSEYAQRNPHVARARVPPWNQFWNADRYIERERKSIDAQLLAQNKSSSSESS
eukprot:TRINITY_DN7377_c0_g1_i1.p1 TRINITY_DN7377_c0_g1~~TRINITY_DN7377_c0_g1_i1.p1  ORF type:complete len:304 (+),score=78.28 TRINITY_DN7377_c0_g1_i1:121-1032(+)